MLSILPRLLRCTTTLGHALPDITVLLENLRLYFHAHGVHFALGKETQTSHYVPQAHISREEDSRIARVVQLDMHVPTKECTFLDCALLGLFAK